MNLSTDRNRGSYARGGSPLTLQVRMENGLPRVREKPAAARRAWKVIRKGSIAVPLYRTKDGPITIAWREHSGAPRKRAMRSDPDVALSFADEIATRLANGESAMLGMSQNDRAAYVRALELLLPTGTPLELACSIYADSLKKLPAGTTIADAISFYLANRPTASGDKLCPDIYDEMLIAREKDGASRNTLDDIKSRVKKFVATFTGPILSLTSNDINDWLRKLPGSRRTRNNYRGNIVDFFRFARSAGYVPKGWDPLADVPRVKNEPVRIEIFTPEEMTKLLAARVAIEEGNKQAKSFVPFMVIGAFAGCRHEEMCAPGLPVLDWRDVDLDKLELHVHADVARKKGYDRITPIQPNLAAWLQRYRKSSGPICEIDNATNALAAAADRAKLSWKDNGLRKSFISYRLCLTKNIGTVATEAGTSPDRIRHNYKKTMPEREGKKWFDILPTDTDILQINFKGL